MRKILSILMALILAMAMLSSVCFGAGPLADDELSADGWKMSASSVNVNQETPEKAIDGNIASCWHTLIEPKAPGPHYIQLEMPKATAISGYRYYPRKQGGAGTCTNYEILVSLDGESFELAAKGSCANDTSPKTIPFGANIVCKYVRLVMINSNGGYGAAGEVRVLAPKDNLKTRDVIPGMVIHKDEIPTDNLEIESSGTFHERGIIRNPLGNLLDANKNTYWKSSDSATEQLPHFLTIVLPKATKVYGYRFTPKADGEGACTSYEIWASANGKNFDKVKEGTWTVDGSEKEVWFDAPVKAKKVKLVMKEIKGSFAMAAEIRLIGEKKKAEAAVAGNTGTGETGELSTAGWTFITSSTNSNNGVPQEKAENVIDGSAESHWHTSISPKAEGPHYITVVLPDIQKVSGYIYTPRTNMGAGTVTKYEISVSLDNVSYTKVAEGDWRHDAEVKIVAFDKGYDAKYVKLTILEGVGGFGSAAEIRLIGSKVTASSEVVQETTGEIATGELSTTGWTFITSSTNSNNGVPQEKAENVIDGSAESHWHTSISPKAEGPHYITVVLPEVHKVGGYIYTPRSNMGAGTVTKYEISVSLDNVNYTKVAEGDWRHDAEVKTVEFEKSYDAKYVKLTILEGVGGFGSAAEIRLIGSKVTASSEAVQETTGEAATGELSTSGWTFITSSTNSNNGVPQEKAENVIDGSAESHWHTTISPKAEGPHYITVVLPEVHKVGGYIYTPRSNMGAGTVTKYEISVSLDNVSYTKVAEGDWRHDAEVKTVEFEKSYDAKYVKLTILEGVGGFGSAAEIRLLESTGEVVTEPGISDYEEKVEYEKTLFPGTRVKSSGIPEELPELMIDGNTDSYWHSEVKPENLPVNLDFDFTYPYTISGISYMPRQDGNFAGYFQEFYIYTSDDGENFDLVKKHSFAQINALEKEIYFDEPIKTKHFRIYLVAGNGGYGTCAELGFIQTKEDYEREHELAEEIYKLKIDSKEIYVKKNGVEKTVETDVAPYIYEGSTMIPLRGLLAEMGAEINWIGDIQRIEVKTDRSFLEFRIEDDEAYMDSVRYSMPVAPQITDGRTFIPLRFVSENLGYNVYWNGETKEITITNYK